MPSDDVCLKRCQSEQSDFEGCAAAIEMCEVVAGGADAFQRKPFATCYINVTSGMTMNQEALQKCMFLAEKGLPLLWIPLNAGGVNSPVTIAGCEASMNAGVLLGIVLSQLIHPGVPVGVPGWNGGPYNLQTMVGNYVLADEQGVPTTMGKNYDLPVFGLGGSTDSKVMDQQCSFEATISLVTALLHGANIVHDVGFMDAGLQGSLQMIVITTPGPGGTLRPSRTGACRRTRRSAGTSRPSSAHPPTGSGAAEGSRARSPPPTTLDRPRGDGNSSVLASNAICPSSGSRFRRPRSNDSGACSRITMPRLGTPPNSRGRWECPGAR